MKRPDKDEAQMAAGFGAALKITNEIVNLPPMRSATSSLIHSYGYDEETKTLYIRFQHGEKLYSYANFPANLFQSMTEAVSAGKFFQQRIVKVYTGRYFREGE